MLGAILVNPIVEQKVNAFKLDAKSKLIKYLVTRTHHSTVLNTY